MSDALALEMRDVVRTFQQASSRLEVLQGVNLQLSRGEIVALVGPSGAGKSTLLHIAGLLEKPDSGDVLIDGDDTGALSDDARTRTRRERLGFVYQYHHLLPEFSALENIMLPQLVARMPKHESRRRATELLDMMGLNDRADHRPARLSGGEQQRVAIARAMANVPAVLLADEPTGNLDPHTADAVFGQLITLVHATGLAALVATHNVDLARRMDRILELQEGVLVAR
ncbi:MAG: ABC transporter ATP-binding protein [Alphaproteobacteria bacterium]|nr:ABC transporter ATP-binding protein [Alphaproteobacteria bacterium]